MHAVLSSADYLFQNKLFQRESNSLDPDQARQFASRGHWLTNCLPAVFNTIICCGYLLVLPENEACYYKKGIDRNWVTDVFIFSLSVVIQSLINTVYS